MTTVNPKLLELQAKLAKLRELKSQAGSLVPQVKEKLEESTQVGESPSGDSLFSMPEELAYLAHLQADDYNLEQITAVHYALQGYDFNLTGAAGTGKTFTEKAVIHELIKTKGIEYFGSHEFKFPGYKRFMPGFAIVAFTKVAVANSKKALAKDPRTKEYIDHCVTIHRLLEYEPVYWEEENEDGKNVTKMKFEPQRHAGNPLDIKLLIIEEASMVDVVVLWKALYDALPDDCQVIFVGDINQLKPVFGRSIFAYSLCKLRTVELTTIYRQGQDSDIIVNAHHVKNGDKALIEQSAKMEFNIIEGNSTYKVDMAKAASGIIGMFKAMIEKGMYDPEQDMILSPWNKRELGTDNINTHIADYLSRKRNAVVHQVIAGFFKHYLAVGDRVMVNRRYATIVKIEGNPKYSGKKPKPSSVALNRFGDYIEGRDPDIDLHLKDILEEDSRSLNFDYSRYFDKEEDIEDKKNSCSHVVTVEFQDDEDETQELSTTGDFSATNFSLGYALTVHKSQGSEWPRVFFVLHDDMKINLSREMLYTAITRAQEQMRIIGKKYLVDYAVDHADCKGSSLAEKIAWFTSGVIQNMDEVPVTKNFRMLNSYRGS